MTQKMRFVFCLEKEQIDDDFNPKTQMGRSIAYLGGASIGKKKNGVSHNLIPHKQVGWASYKGFFIHYYHHLIKFLTSKKGTRALQFEKKLLLAGLLKRRRRSFAQTFFLLSFEYTQVTSDIENVVPSGILNAEAKIIHFTLL